MRRAGGILAITTLIAALCCGTPWASTPALGIGAANADLGSQLMLRLFGETNDSNASFAAARGDRTGESPLRELALALSPTKADWVASDGMPSMRDSGAASSVAAQPSDIAAVFDAGAASGVHFAPPAQSRSDAVTLLPSNPLLTATYQPVAPVPDISPAPGTLAFNSMPAATKSAALLPPTMRVGPVQFQGHVEGTSSETPVLSMRDTSEGAGANFQLKAGKREINVDLSTQYEHLLRNDNTSFSSALDSASAWKLPNADAPFVIPSYADLNRFSVGAGIAVPVLRGLTLNLNYGAQRLYGGYGLPGLMNLDGIDNTYGGKLTFNIPDATKTLSISAYQDRFTDSLLPVTQTREDVNFTVKF